MPSDTSKPIRIQRKRTKGWHMPANTVYVGRPSEFGNPYRVMKKDPYVLVNRANAVDMFLQCVRADHWNPTFNLENIKRKLKGKNLACWCPLDQPCHADVLLRIANND